MSRRGFSLVEVMVALLLIVLLAAGVYSFMWGVLDDRTRLEVHSARQIGATRLFASIESDLSTCVAKADDGAAGVKGDESSMAITRRSVRLDAQDAHALGDATRSEYKFEAAGTRIAAKRDAGDLETLVAGVSKVRFRYRRGDEWVTSYDSASEGGVPAAIEISVWFVRPAQEPKPEQEADSASAEDEPLPAPDRATIIAVHDATASGTQGGEQ
ncbi:MAG: prepilin-type N-terminal cleavage/methylation domain-containing protein [Phycisphaerales bacterium]